MADFLEELGLHYLGFSDEQIAEIDAAIPKVKVLLDFAKTHHTMIQQLIATADMVSAVVKRHEQESS